MGSTARHAVKRDESVVESIYVLNAAPGRVRGVSTKAVLFDLDGTLADTVPLIAEHISAALTHHGIACTPRDVYPLIGRPIVDAMVELHDFGDDAEHRDTVITHYRDTLKAAVDEAGDELVLPGVVEMLRELRSAGFQIGVVTAKGADAADQLLAITRLDRFVEVLVTTDDVAKGKPAPDSALLGLEKLGAGADTTWYVGDAASDIAMAHAAGMPAIGITTGAATREELGEAEYVVDTPAEVTALLLGPAA